ncbi:MAG: hypothetical protein EAZ53_02475 [Bacteroidetes bacterium]|nr:MAG: hypothetical protein EAZ53_02475 [Bacteroidota bacterium]
MNIQNCKKTSTLFFLTFFCLFFNSILAFSHQKVMVFDKNFDYSRNNLNSYLSLYEDPNDIQSLNDILKNHQNLFTKPSKNPKLDFGFTKSKVWCMFAYKDSLTTNNHHVFRIENNVVYYIDYFIFNEKDSLIKSGKTGMYREKKLWEVTHHYPSFILPDSKNKTFKVFIKTWSDETTAFNISIKTQVASLYETYHSQFLYGMYYGAVVIMILYNLFIFFTTKDISYLYYVLYISSLCFLQFNMEGKFLLYFTPENPRINILSAIILFSLVVIFAYFFIFSFLERKYFAKWQHIGFSFIVTVSLLVILMCPFISYALSFQILFGLLIVFVVPIVLFTIYGAYFKGFKAARFLLVGWTSLMIGTFIFGASEFSLIPYNFWSVNALLIGTLIEVLFLSFALGDKINFLRKEKDEALKRTIYQLDANSRLMNKLNEEQNNTFLAFLKGEEQERTRLSNEIHDGMGQILVGLKLQIGSIFKIAKSKEIEKDFTDSLENLKTKIDEACEESRSISHNLLPLLVQEYGLYKATEEMVRNLNKSSTDETKIFIQNKNFTKRLSPVNELIIYRVLQESISNIIKHSNFTEAYIQFIVDDYILTITIEDNGKGFDENSLKLSKGIGIKNMQSRIEFLKGAIHLDSAVGKGTTVMIEIPLNEI